MEQVNATSSKQDEPIVSNEQKEENKQESSRSNSQQDKRQKKKTCKNQAAHQDIQENGLACHINDQLEQDDRKDDATDQQLSSRDGQDDGKRNRASGSDTSKKKQKNKVNKLAVATVNALLSCTTFIYEGTTEHQYRQPLQV